MLAFIQFLLSLLGPVEGIFRSCVEVSRQVGLLVLAPFAWLASKLSAFGNRWMASRNRIWLIQGMPAFLVAMVVGATTLAAWLPTRRDIANKYLDRAIESSDEGDHATAGLYIEKAARALHRSESSEFRRALVMEDMGRTKEAGQLLMELAPVDQVGFIPAHELVIDRLLTDTKNPRAEELIKVHTSLVLGKNPRHARVHRLLAFKAIQDKQLNAALEHLDFAVEKFDRLRLPYAQLLRVDRQLDKSNYEAEKLVEWFQTRFQKASEKKFKGEIVKPEDESTIQDHVAYSASLTLLKRYDEGIGVLSQGLNELTEKEITEEEKETHKQGVKILRSTLANTYLKWSDTYGSDSLVDLTEKMIRLDPALKLAPDSPAVLSRIAQIATLEGRPAETANERMQQILAMGKAPAVVHFVLGTSAAQKQDTEKALFHLEQASRINPNVPVTLNNLAWVLSHEKGAKEDPAKLARAKQLIDKAVKFRPKSAQFRETRGQIALLQGQWADSIADLEFALQNLKTGQVPVHESLALAYTEMQNPKMAQMHTQLALARTKGQSAVAAFENDETNSQSPIAETLVEQTPIKESPIEQLPIAQLPIAQQTQATTIDSQAKADPKPGNGPSLVATKNNMVHSATPAVTRIEENPTEGKTPDLEKPPAVVTNETASPDADEIRQPRPDQKPEMRIGPTAITGPINVSPIRPAKLKSGNSKATSPPKVEELPGPADDDDDEPPTEQKPAVEEIPAPRDN